MGLYFKKAYERVALPVALSAGLLFGYSAAAASAETSYSAGGEMSTGTHYQSGKLKGSKSSLKKQNEVADKHNMSRMKNKKQIKRMKNKGYLKKLPRKTEDYYTTMPEDLAYVRPYTKLFIERFSSQYGSKFDKRLKISSATRTFDYQRHLRKRNRNAAPYSGPLASSHLTGATIDISKKGMSNREKRWIRNVLITLEKKGYIEAVEEFAQSTFHVMVYPEYASYVDGLKKKDSKRKQ